MRIFVFLQHIFLPKGGWINGIFIRKDRCYYRRRKGCSQRRGGCGSIGYGIAVAYAKEGANLVITGRNVKKLEDAKEELERLYGVNVLPVQADVSKDGDNEKVVRNVVDRAVETFGGIDVLINNAQASASGITLC